RDVMTAEVVYCRDDDGLAKVCQTMATRRVRRLPVLDDRDLLVGFLGLPDLIPVLGSHDAGQLIKALCEEPEYIAPVQPVIGRAATRRATEDWPDLRARAAGPAHRRAVV